MHMDDSGTWLFRRVQKLFDGAYRSMAIAICKKGRRHSRTWQQFNL